MTRAVVLPGTGSDLDNLAANIREAHAEVEAGVRTTLEAAIKCGELLTEAKQAVKHGEWGGWLEDNFPASQSTAVKYMKLAANSERVTNLDGGIQGALKLLAEQKAEETEEYRKEVMLDALAAYRDLLEPALTETEKASELVPWLASCAATLRKWIDRPDRKMRTLEGGAR